MSCEIKFNIIHLFEIVIFPSNVFFSDFYPFYTMTHDGIYILSHNMTLFALCFLKWRLAIS